MKKNKTMGSDPGLISNEAAAAMVGISLPTWFRHRLTGAAPAPAIKRARFVRFDRAAVQEFAARITGGAA